MAMESRFVPFLPHELDYEQMSIQQLNVLHDQVAAEIQRRDAAEALGQNVDRDVDSVVADNVVESTTTMSVATRTFLPTKESFRGWVLLEGDSPVGFFVL